MSTRFLHISDLHFGPPFVPAVAESMLKSIPSLNLDAVVVSGDLTQRAKRSQFEEAKQFFNRLPDIPMLVIPGNHDVALWRIFERFFKPHALYCEIINPDLNPVLHVGDVVFAGLDSTSPRRSISNGRLDLRQLEHCAGVFSTVPDDKARIVVAHHQFAPGHDRVFDIAMPGARRAIEYFVDHKVENDSRRTPASVPISVIRWTSIRGTIATAGSSSYSVAPQLHGAVSDASETKTLSI